MKPSPSSRKIQPAHAERRASCGEASFSKPPRLSEELQRLIESVAERRVRLREVLEVMHGRGYTMLLILLSFPFCTPVPLPGFSTPFGLVVTFIGFRLALGHKPWLPARLLNTELPPRFFPRILGATRWLVRLLERFLKPRRSEVFHWRLVRHGAGVMVFVCGLLLMLPLPIPFSNGLPAFTVLLLAAAMLEEDSYVAIASACVFVLTLAFFAAIFWGGAEGVHWLRTTFGDMLKPDDGPTEIGPEY